MENNMKYVHMYTHMHTHTDITESLCCTPETL